jgi:hypothetical protein
MTDEKCNTVVVAEVKSHFAPVEPQPKEKIAPKIVQHFVDMLERPSSHVANRPSDYDRCIEKSYNEMQRTRSSASGKKVPQLGEQEIQSIPPLKVLPDKDVAPDYNDIASETGLTFAQLIGGEDIPMDDLAWKFAHGQPLVRPEQVRQLPTQMRRYSKEGRLMLMVKVKKEHYFREDEICINFEELFQLYNQDALDKSIVSCYCL